MQRYEVQCLLSHEKRLSACSSAPSGCALRQVAWIIRGPNGREVLPPLNTDIREPVNGSFFFRDREEGTRSIDLRILPHGEVEVEETFVVELSILSGEVDVDPWAGFITLKVFPNVGPGLIEHRKLFVVELNKKVH